MTTSRNWIIGWLIAFLGFPLGGLISSLIIGRLESPVEGVIGGVIVGITVGGAQMLALRRRVPVDYRWIIATVLALAVGMSVNLALFGTETSANAIITRAPLTGLMLGIAQWFILRQRFQYAYLWVIINAIGYTIAWLITAQVIGNNVNEGFVVFGSSGAILFQTLTGLTLWLLFRFASGNARSMPDTAQTAPTIP